MKKVLVYNVYMKGEDCVGILLLQGKGDGELNLLVFSCVCTLYACKYSSFTSLIVTYKLSFLEYKLKVFFV